MSSLIRFHYDPFTEFDHLFDDAFNARFWPSAPSAEAGRVSAESLRPRLDLHKSKDSNTVTATFELPGLNSEDVAIDLHHNRLTVSGEWTTTDAREDSGYAEWQCEDVKAKMENGLLTLTFPKATEQQPQRIVIQ